VLSQFAYKHPVNLGSGGLNRVANVHTSKNTWSLLLVEPDSDDAELARRILTQELDGCQVCIATDAVGYAKHFADGELSAVISELDLGWGSGTEVLASFAQRKPDTRLILFARKLPSDIQRLSNEIGLTGYAEKSGAGFLRLPHLVKAAPEDGRSSEGGEILWTLEYTELLHAVSHDLQEPLQLILRHAKLLRDVYGKKLDDNGVRFVDNLFNNSRRMQSMLDDLLEFSRIGRMETGASEVDLNAVVREVIDLYQPRLAEIEGQVQCKELPKVVADRGQMIRLFQNLIGNAIKFHGADPLVVLIEARHEEGYLELIVEDNGIGIDAADRDAIFGMFKRLHTQDEYPGNGIGLATCRRIVSLHGGEIWARPSESHNRGMVVHFSLPRTRLLI
jgi:signal transduction histidine kinase